MIADKREETGKGPQPSFRVRKPAKRRRVNFKPAAKHKSQAQILERMICDQGAGERMQNVAVKFVLLLALGLAAASLAAQTSSPSDGSSGASIVTDKPAPAASPGNATPAQDSDYVIGADDLLKIVVWKETELTETLPVRPDGKISMPLLGDVAAAGMTPTDLAESIRQKLKKYIADPRVTVVVAAMNSRRVFVTGEVSHSGAIPLLPHMTVLQALSSAGFTQFANLKAIYVLRNEGGRQTKLPFNYKEVVKGQHAEENVELRPGDTVVVP
jgi:polysaccharide biosynthesis/export protein